MLSQGDVWHTSVFVFCDAVIKSKRLGIWHQNIHKLKKLASAAWSVFHARWAIWLSNGDVSIKKLFPRRCFHLNCCQICWLIYGLADWQGICLAGRAMVSCHISLWTMAAPHHWQNEKYSPRGTVFFLKVLKSCTRLSVFKVLTYVDKTDSM